MLTGPDTPHLSPSNSSVESAAPITALPSRVAPMNTIRVAAAQTIEFWRDIESAFSCLTDLSRQAEAESAKLLCLPECFLQGYLTDEASARRFALDLASAQFAELLARFPKTGPVLVIGFIEASQGKLYNSAMVISAGSLIGCYRKIHLLPCEKAFTPGEDTPIFDIAGLRVGIAICHDTNFPIAAPNIADRGATLMVCPANNMMERDRAELFRDRHNTVRADRCRETGLWLLSADVTGERDGRISWGPTALINPDGDVVDQLPLGKPGLLIVDIPAREVGGRRVGDDQAPEAAKSASPISPPH